MVLGPFQTQSNVISDEETTVGSLLQLVLISDSLTGSLCYLITS